VRNLTDSSLTVLDGSRRRTPRDNAPARNPAVYCVPSKGRAVSRRETFSETETAENWKDVQRSVHTKCVVQRLRRLGGPLSRIICRLIMFRLICHENT
jgi:hypothetical protein